MPTYPNRAVTALPSTLVHPDYAHYASDWQRLRDTLAGERAVKEAGEKYLRRLSGHDNAAYSDYLDRAVFHPMTGGTHQAMLGSVFSKSPSIKALPEKFKRAVNSFEKSGQNHATFAKKVVSEQLATGRYGVLVDAPSEPMSPPTSYVVGYCAEDILDWSTSFFEGREKLVRVLLRELVRDESKGSDQNPWIGVPNAITERNRARAGDYRSNARRGALHSYRVVYRELALEDGAYVQRVFEDCDPTGEPSAVFVPRIRGEAFDFIPFAIFGSSFNTFDVEPPPLLGIANLNLSHYRTYAELESGRLYTSLPIYYAPGRDGERAAQYHIGPSIVWEVPDGSEPGILEYKGEGLGALERGLSSKEHQIAAIGGKLMAHQSRASESDGQASLRAANENALLANVVQAAESGMSQVIRWWLMWRDVPLSETESLAYQLHLSSTTIADARLLRALQSLYEAGAVTIEVIYNAVVEAGYLDPETTLEEFVESLSDEASFPNNPNVAARRRGFDSRQQEIDQATVARDADSTM